MPIRSTSSLLASSSTGRGVISDKHIGPMTEETIENYLMEIFR